MIVIGHAAASVRQLSCGIIMMVIVVVFVMTEWTVHTWWCAKQMIVANVAIKCDGIVANLVVLAWAGRTTVGRTYGASWWGERTSLVMLGYWNFQRRIYHIRVFHSSGCFRRHFKRMIDVTLKQYAYSGARKPKCAPAIFETRNDFISNAS